MKNFKRLHLIYDIKKSDDEEESRVLKFRGSDATVDRVRDTMKVSGWDVKNFKANPVFLWAHDTRSLPIGKAVKVKKEEDGLDFDIEFVSRDISPFADTVFKLYKGGFLNAVSVGFIPKDQEWDPDTQTNEIKKMELLELSAVPVPANPSALMIHSLEGAVDKGVINEQEAYEFNLTYEEAVSKCESCTSCICDKNDDEENEEETLDQKFAKTTAETIDSEIEEENTEEKKNNSELENIFDTILKSDEIPEQDSRKEFYDLLKKLEDAEL